MMKWNKYVIWWKRFSNKWTRGYLVKKIPRFFSQVFSHGAFHLLLCVIVFLVTFLWARSNMSYPKTSQRVISYDLSTIYKENINQPSILNCFYLNFTFDSDSLKKKKGYKDEISLIYDDSNWNSNDKQPNDTLLISVFTLPMPNELKITQNDEEIPFVTTDSVINIKFYPKRSVLSPFGDTVVGPQRIELLTNQLGREKNSSYYNYYINFASLQVKNDTAYGTPQTVSITFGDIDWKRGMFIGQNKNLLYNYVYPEPSIITNSFIYYIGSDHLKRISNNHGIIVQATDVDALNKNTNKQMIYSVLVATGATLLFDILIQVIRELRNVNRRNDYRKSRIGRPRKRK